MPDKKEVAEIVSLLEQAAPLIEKVKGNGVHLNFHDPVFIAMFSAEDAKKILDFFQNRRGATIRRSDDKT